MNMKSLISAVLLLVTFSNAQALLVFNNPDNAGQGYGAVDFVSGSTAGTSFPFLPTALNLTSNTFQLETLDPGLAWTNFVLTVYDFTVETGAQDPAVQASINGEPAVGGQFAALRVPTDPLPTSFPTLPPFFNLAAGTIYNVYRFSFSGVSLAGGANTFVTLSGFDTSTLFGNVQDAGAAVLSMTAVPEPSTYALLLAGLAAVGWIVRRKTSSRA